MPSLRIRSTQPEWMDTEPVGPDDFAACLADLGTVNTLTLARAPTLGFLRRAARRRAGPLRVLDVGFGGGDMLRRVSRWGARGGHDLVLAGVDLNPLSTAAAQAATPSACNIEYHTGDAFQSAGAWDVVISSLLTHHMTDAELLPFLAWMERTAAVGWFVNDLHRHPVAYHGFKLLARAAGWHRFVQHDGPLSVARSFRRADWERLLHQAGLSSVARIGWRLPFRYCVTRLR